jgi:hypothetical protein
MDPERASIERQPFLHSIKVSDAQFRRESFPEYNADAKGDEISTSGIVFSLVERQVKHRDVLLTDARQSARTRPLSTMSDDTLLSSVGLISLHIPARQIRKE